MTEQVKQYQKPLLPFDKPIAEHFRENGWFKTGKLLSSWYMLSNKNISVLIDTVKPKIVNIFVYGKYGTLRALLYDTGWSAAMSDWLFGIVPVYQKSGEYYMPIQYGAVVTESDNVEFDSDNNSLIMKGLRFFPSDRKGDPVSSAIDVVGYDEEEKEKRLAGGATEIRADWGIRLLENAIEMSVSYSDSVESQRLVTFWHPIFTHSICGQNGRAESIEYAKNAILNGKDEVKLTDEQGRMPQITISSAESRISIQPRSEKTLRGAYRLPVEIFGDQILKTRITIEPNDVTLEVNPHIDADTEQRITVFADDKPVLHISGEDAQVQFEQVNEGIWTGKVNLPDGEHFLLAKTCRGQSSRRIFAHGDPRNKMKKVGETYLKLQYKEGPLKDLFPYVYYVGTLEPITEWWGANEGTCGSYAIRLCSLLAALYELFNDRRFSDSLFKKLSAHYEKCHKFKDGSVMPPPDLQPDGTLVPGSEEWPRPWNQFEAVKAYTLAYHTFKRHNEEDRAIKCLEWAAGYAKTIINMQRPNGSLHERYRFGTFEPCIDKVFLTPMSLGLTEYIKALDVEGVSFLGMTPDRVRQIITDQVDYARSLPESDFKMLAGGEASGNSPSWFTLFSTGRMLSRYAYPEDVRDDDRLAMDAAKLSIYLCAFYPDYPQFYMIQACIDVASHVCCSLGEMVAADWKKMCGVSLMSKGDMDDYNQALIGAALLRHGKEDIGLLPIRYALASRLSTAILDNGEVCECEVDVPGYRFRKTEFTMADVNAATLGETLFQYATDIPIV